MTVVPTLDNTFGAAFIGDSITNFLYGVTCAQIVRLIRDAAANRDSRALRYTVVVLWALDTAHMIVSTYSAYLALIILHGQITMEDGTRQAIALIILLSSISDFLVRGILLSRIFLLSEKSFWLCLPLGALMAVSAASGVYCALICYSTGTFVVLYGPILWPVLACISVSALADTAISAVLCLLFRRMSHKVDIPFPLLHKLSGYAIGCGIIPSVIALAALASYVLFHGSEIYIGIYCTVSKSTLNSMLYMLNARRNLRAKTQKENYVRAHVCLEVDLKALEGDVKVVASNGRQSRAGATV